MSFNDKNQDDFNSMCSKFDKQSVNLEDCVDITKKKKISALIIGICVTTVIFCAVLSVCFVKLNKENSKTNNIPISVTTEFVETSITGPVIYETLNDLSESTQTLRYPDTVSNIEPQISATTKQQTVAPERNTTSYIDDNILTGTCGSNLYWKYDKSICNLTISGTGAMYDWEYNTTPWDGFKFNIKSVYVEDGITNIGDYAFYYFSSCTSIRLPKTLTSIGESSISECSRLKSITIPEGVKTIEKFAFYNSYYLETVSLPDTVTEIGKSAFQYCKMISEITLPQNLIYIGDSAFYDCEKIKKVIIPDSVQTIERLAFWSCNSLELVTIGNTVTNIPDRAFADCTKLSRVVLGKNISSIQEYAFSGCNIEVLSLPDGLTFVGKYAFSQNRNFSEVYIPNTLTYIDDYAFNNSYVNIIYYSGTKEEWSKIYIGKGNNGIMNTAIRYNS